MSNAIAYSRAQCGIDAPLVKVEVHLSKGLPGFSIVGLPETAVKESRDRVRSAILNTGFDMPVRKIIVNLAPADLPKEGARFDLAIAIGILCASKQIRQIDLEPYEFAGELGLTGDIRPIEGILPFAMSTDKAKRTLIVNEDNAAEAALSGGKVLQANHLLEVTAHMNGVETLTQATPPELNTTFPYTVDLADIHGQAMAKQALMIAAAGGHSLLMQGPPGTGKSMLAQCLPSLLPALNKSEALQVAGLYSISKQGFNISNWRLRPFRSPHHTSSAVALVGGGGQPKPGEISLSHQGILFLDELPEFSRKVLEVLREPIETGVIHISRAAQSVTYPAQFQLVCAMNPCPCGYLTDTKKECRCTPGQIENYQNKISGPLLDRIDMHLEVPRVPVHEMIQAEKSQQTSASVREQIESTQAMQMKRQGCLNARINPAKTPIEIEPNAKKRLLDMIERFALSGRAYYRILKLARTIADLGGHDVIEMHHMQSAFSLRKFDFKN